MKLLVDIINHIEDNLNDEITVQTVSGFSGYSPHHFQKVFVSCVGMSLGAYIRRRRLTKSALELSRSKTRIIDIALSAGFESQEAYTRAFKQMFGVTPNEYRKKKLKPSITAQSVFKEQYVDHLESRNVNIQPKIETKEGFSVVGLGATFERLNPSRIGSELWPGFMKRFEEIPGKLGKDKNGYITYGVCKEIWVNKQIQDSFEYYACVQAVPGGDVPREMVELSIPGQKYAIFTHFGSLDKLSLTHQYIWGSWLPQSKFELVQTSDIEVFPSNFRPGNKVPFEIWVPIKER